jgi:hypothetical protein
VDDGLWWATGQEQLRSPNEEHCYLSTPRDEGEVASQIWIWLNTIVEVSRHQKGVARDLDERIENIRRCGGWVGKGRLDIDVGHVYCAAVYRDVGVECVSNVTSRSPPPQEAGNPSTPGLVARCMGL